MTNTTNDQNRPDATPGTITIVLDALPQDFLPDVPWPWMLPVGDELLPVNLRAGDDWREVAFMVRWSTVGPNIKVTRTLDGRVWAEKFHSAGPSEQHRGIVGGEWRPLDDTEQVPLAVELTAFAKSWAEDDLRVFVHALATRALDRADGEVEAMERAIREEKEQAHSWRRRVRALEVRDPDARSVALALADNWTGSTDDLASIVAEVAAPVVLPPDSPPPAL